MTLLTPKLGILIKTYESTVNTVQLYNLAKLRKWKNKYTVQFFKVVSPFKIYFCKSLHIDWGGHYVNFHSFVIQDICFFKITDDKKLGLRYGLRYRSLLRLFLKKLSSKSDRLLLQDSIITFLGRKKCLLVF